MKIETIEEKYFSYDIKYRSVFISDVHLGSGKTNYENLVKLLTSIEVENLFLIGDIIDFYLLNKNPFLWSNLDSSILIETLTKFKGNIFYITGNHEKVLNGINTDIKINNSRLVICRSMVYKMHNASFLLVHGDELDFTRKLPEFLVSIGYKIFNLFPNAIRINKDIKHNNHINEILVKPSFLKRALMTLFQSLFVFNVINSVKNNNKNPSQVFLDGVICGHIHQALLDKKGVKNKNKLHKYDIVYGNCGEWVDKGSFIVDSYDKLLLVKF